MLIPTNLLSVEAVGYSGASIIGMAFQDYAANNTVYNTTLPSGTQEGDTLICCMGMDAYQYAELIMVTTGFSDLSSGARSSGVELGYYNRYKVLTATDISTGYIQTKVNSTGVRYQLSAMGLWVVRGGATPTVKTEHYNSTPATTISIPSVSTTVDNALYLVASCFDDNALTSISSYPSEYPVGQGFGASSSTTVGSASTMVLCGRENTGTGSIAATSISVTPTDISGLTLIEVTKA